MYQLAKDPDLAQHLLLSSPDAVERACNPVPLVLRHVLVVQRGPEVDGCIVVASRAAAVVDDVGVVAAVALHLGYVRPGARAAALLLVRAPHRE